MQSATSYKHFLRCCYITLNVVIAIALGTFPKEACSQNAPWPIPIVNPGKPWASNGFVVTAPEGSGWATSFRHPDGVQIGLPAWDRIHTFIFLAETERTGAPMNQEGLIALLRRAWEPNQQGPRYKLRSINIKPTTYLDRPCARFEVVAEDGGLLIARSALMLVNKMVCVHPDSSNVIVAVSYSERGDITGFTPALAEFGERFMNSLRFTPIEVRDEYQKLLTTFSERGSQESTKALRQLAENGDIAAAESLGFALLRGNVIPRDDPKARAWLESAAIGGRRVAAYWLGRIYDDALGIPRDAAEAARWYSLAADQRLSDALFRLALLYRAGDGVEKNPDKATLWFQVAANEGHEGAKAALEESQQTDGPPVRLAEARRAFNRGSVHFERQDYASAKLAFDEAVGFNPKYALAYQNRGRTFIKLGQGERALQDFDQAILLDPDYALAYYNRGQFLNQSKKYPQAIQDFEQSMRKQPKNPEPYNVLAWLLATVETASLRDGKRATELALKACELSNWKNSNYIDTLATAYARSGNFSKAIEWQQKVLLDPAFKDSREAQERLTLFQQGKPWPSD